MRAPISALALSFFWLFSTVVISGHAASPTTPTGNTTYMIGPPPQPEPAHFSEWPADQRANWLLKSFDTLGLAKEMAAAAQATPIQWQRILDWAAQTLKSPDAAPIVASLVTQIYELSEGKSRLSAGEVNEAKRRASIYWLGALAMTVVDSGACGDVGARRESVKNALDGARQSFAWLKTVPPDERTDVLNRAIALENASWGQRQGSPDDLFKIVR
jgi:hypothetical protein